MQKDINILVTGAGGQLGLTLKELSNNFKEHNWFFLNSEELDITNKEELTNFFKLQKVDYCINCAAYTNVELAETEKEKAFSVNFDGVKNITDISKNFEATLIHISTDYVFDGAKSTSYVEEDQTNPINVYGASKLAGENYIINNLKKHYILRTSWLYSKFKKNFYTTIKAKLAANEKLYITDNQTGAPTSCKDLAASILHIINSNKEHYGVYHFSNAGKTNWYLFAKKIIKQINEKKLENLFVSEAYVTKAARPKNSKLNSSKFEKTFKFKIPHWEDGIANIELQ